MLSGKKILIIGGTGSWGQELTRQILEKYDPHKIIIFSRGEHKQVEMRIKFDNSKLDFIIGNIRDKQSIKLASIGVDYIFHLAALKHVPVCERNPEETIKTNVNGTINSVEAAIENNVKKFIFVSTDKAVDPINIYGISKAAAERIVITANIKATNTKFVCVRAGNVLGSNGSVIPLFKEQIKRTNRITLTDDKMNRYIMKLEEAISLIFKAIKEFVGGEIFVTKMPSMRIVELAEVMIEHLGDKDTKIIEIGLRPGEKLHEVLVSKYEASRTIEYGKYFIVLPTIEMNDLKNKWKNTFINREYNSVDNKFLSKKEIYEILLENNWLNESNVKILDNYSKEEILNYFKKEGWISEK